MVELKEHRCVVIEGELARVQRTVVEHEVRTGELLREVARLQPLETGLLPRGCVWYARRADEDGRVTSVYVLERPAAVTSVRYRPRPNAPADEVRTLGLSWPNTLWFALCAGEAIQELYLAATEEPLAARGRETPLKRLPMPNLYEGGDGPVCLGDLAVAEGPPLPARVAALVEQVLQSLWNPDLLPSFENTGIAGLEDWSERSAADPEFHRGLRLSAHRFPTCGALLDRLLEPPA